MKVTTKLPAVILLSLLAATAFGQGLIYFYNTPTTLVSAGQAGHEAVISGPPGSYYFGLFIAYGTSDPKQFTFSGLYATNLATAGLFSGQPVSEVPGWAKGTVSSVLVVGWSASLGHDWNQQWLSGNFATNGYFGLSPIATGISGGGGGGVPAPPAALFGGFLIQTGWNLAPVTLVPEPSNNALMALGVGALVLYTRSKNKSKLLMRQPTARSALDAGVALCFHVEARRPSQ